MRKDPTLAGRVVFIRLKTNAGYARFCGES
jgi:hypothetical protein